MVTRIGSQVEIHFDISISLYSAGRCVRVCMREGVCARVCVCACMCVRVRACV